MRNWRAWLMMLLAIGATALVLAQGPVAQPQDYHQFADQRRLLGLPNALDVLSNLAFVCFGIAGLLGLRKIPAGALPELRPAYAAFFAGAVLIGLGSAYYHLAPDNARLVWDRLPMTLSFMALVAVLIGEHFDPRWARRLLAPLLLVGLASVLYWWFSERAGQGDLRPYVLVQFLPVLMLPVVLLLYPSRFDSTRALWTMIGLYLLAKLFELADAAILAQGELVSGHTLKHLAAAAAVGVMQHALRHRRRRR